MSLRSPLHRATARRLCVAALALLVPIGLVASCSSDDDAATTTTAAESTTTAPATLTILVTNDDGVAAEGIDVLVTALKAMPDTDVVVSAPAENQSGSAGKTTPGELTATPTTMLGGTEATAVRTSGAVAEGSAPEPQPESARRIAGISATRPISRMPHSPDHIHRTMGSE